MSAETTALQHSAIQQACKQLRLPGIAAQCQRLAAQAEREHQGYLGYLDTLLGIELEERERHTVARRLKEAHLPRVKTLEEFDFAQAPQLSPSRIAALAEGGYLERAEPVAFLGDSGTGKTHLLTALCVAACRQKRRVRFDTAAGLVNELVEAKQQLQLRRVLARWARYDLIAIDEVGYVPLAEVGAEFLFQVIAERAEHAAVILTTNLPFSEWTQVIPNTRLDISAAVPALALLCLFIPVLANVVVAVARSARPTPIPSLHLAGRSCPAGARIVARRRSSAH